MADSTEKTRRKLPEPLVGFKDAYPDVWKAFTRFGDACHSAGPLDERSRRLVEVALAIGAGLEGGAHSAVRNALAAGVSADEIRHVVALAATTLGLPAAVRGWTWVNDVVEGAPFAGEGDAGE
jgi:alkylhydroperoxidase/carboxymuconolactone decarboxylase family protein YurZ